MPEILTESFCERCGTRYTFQSTTPKVGRFTKMKVLSRGLKNYVLSDEASLDEALADARSIDDRQQSVEQLDAFHKTFNFCMSCRQYTCGNCWNEAEGRCFSCAPSLNVGGPTSSFPDLNPVTGIGALGLAGNGHEPGNGRVPEPLPDAAAWPEADLAAEADQPTALASSTAIEDRPISRLEALFGREAAERIQAAAPESDEDAPEMIGLEAPVDEIETDEAPIDAVASAEPGPAAASALTADEPEVDDALATAIADGPPAEDAVATFEADALALPTEVVGAQAAAIAGAVDEADEAEPAAAADGADDAAAAAKLAADLLTVLPVDPETDELAAAAAAQTHGLLDKFRARPVDLPTSQVPSPPPYTMPSPPPYTPSTALPYAAQAPQPYAGQTPQPYGPPMGPPYPAPAAPPQPFPSAPSPYANPPVPYPQFAPQYAAPPPAPPPASSWRMVAPETPPLGTGAPGRPYDGPQPEPQWPTAPAWPAPLARTSRTRGAEAVWAESTRDLLNRPDTGVSACFNCGLPLSATARFCRRCGTSQISS
jgi:hypothetical protein